MFRTTTFDRQLWQLSTFDTISYQKNSQVLRIHCFDGLTLQFHSITEELIFQFILDKNKEQFVKCKLKPFLETINEQNGCLI